MKQAKHGSDIFHKNSAPKCAARKKISWFGDLSLTLPGWFTVETKPTSFIIYCATIHKSLVLLICNNSSVTK